MKFMNIIFKNLTVFASVLILIGVGFMIYKISESKRLVEKFESTKLNSNWSEIKTSWGIPDSEFNYDGNRLLKYSDGLGWGNYIFVFDHNNNLVGKYFDD